MRLEPTRNDIIGFQPFDNKARFITKSEYTRPGKTEMTAENHEPRLNLFCPRPQNRAHPFTQRRIGFFFPIIMRGVYGCLWSADTLCCYSLCSQG